MATTPDGLTILGPGEGDAFPSMDVVRKATAAQTGVGGIVVVRGMPGEGGRTHIHRGESEAFYILEGSVEFLGATSTTPLTAGAFALVPPDTEHGVRVIGDTPASWLAVWPAALDGFPEELERLISAGADATTIATLRRHHGVAPGRQR